MYPVLLRLGPVTIYSYGFFLALAFLVGTFVIWQESRRRGFDEEKILDFILISILGGIIVGRIVYVFFYLPYFMADWVKIFLFWKAGGFQVLGVFVGVFVAGIIYLKRKRWPVFLSYDFFVLGLALAQVFERIGFFLSTSGVGKETTYFGAILFPGEVVKRYPVALYEAFFLALTFVSLLYLHRKNQRGEKPQEGLIFNIYLFFMALMNLLFAFLKKKAFSEGNLNLTLISIGLIIGAGLVVFYLRSGKKFRGDFKLFTWLTKIFAKKKKEGIRELVESTKELKV